MDPSWRQPHPNERFVENVLQETHHLPSSSGNQRRPLNPGGSHGKGTLPSHPHGGQRPDRPAMRPSFESCLSSASVNPPIPKLKGHPNSKRLDTHMYKLGENPERALPRGQYQGLGNTSEAIYSSDRRGSTKPPNHRPLSSTYKNARTEQFYERGRAPDASHTLSDSQSRHDNPHQDTFREGHQSKEGYGESHSRHHNERHRRYHEESRKWHSDDSCGKYGESHGRHYTESHRRFHKDAHKMNQNNTHGRYPSEHYEDHHGETHGRYHDELHRRSSNESNERYGKSGNKPYKEDHRSHKGTEKWHTSHERTQYQSDSGLMHEGSHFEGREKSRLNRSRHQSGPCAKVPEDKESGEAPHRSRHRSESNEKYSSKDLSLHRKNNPNSSHNRIRSQSESSIKYSKIGVVKKKSPVAPKTRSPESQNVLPGVSSDDDLSASKKQNTMMWLLNSTASSEDDQLASGNPAPHKAARQRTNDQTLSPNGDNPRASFIMVQDKAGWSKRIYSDGSSGVISGMEDCRKSPSNYADTYQKRHAEGERESHLKKKSKAQRRISNSSSSHQSGPSYGALLCMAKQNLKNGHHDSDSKSADKTPERTRRNSHQSCSEPEQRSPSPNRKEEYPKCDFDEEKVERLFKASLSARPTLEEKQKVKKQTSVESHSGVDSCITSSKIVSKISIEKVGKLFDASLNAKSKIPELPSAPVDFKPTKNPLDDIQSPERPQYTCTLTSTESGSEQSEKHITMSFRKLPRETPKKPLGSHHKFHKKSVKRLLLEASSRAVHVPLKRLQLKSDRIFLTDEYLLRLGRSSNIIVNTARKHSPLEGKKPQGIKHKLKRKPLHIFSSSDTDAPSTSNRHQAQLQLELPLRQALSDSAALSESSVSSGVANLFHELSTDPSKTEHTAGSSTSAGMQEKPKVTGSPKFSGSISKLKQAFGKRIQAAVHGERQGGLNSGNETDSTLFGSSAGEGYQVGDADYIPFSSGVEDVIFEETVTTEVDEEMEVEEADDAMTDDDEGNSFPLKDAVVETMATCRGALADASDGASDGVSSPDGATTPEADPCDSTGDHSMGDNHTDAESETGDEDKKAAAQNEQQMPEEGPLNSTHPKHGSYTTAGTTRTDRLSPELSRSQLGLKPNEPNETNPKVDALGPQASAHLSSSSSHQPNVTEDHAAQDLLEDIPNPAGDMEDTDPGDPGEDVDALNDSESLPDVDLNGGDDKDSRKDGASQNTLDSMELDLELSMASTTDDSQPTNTPTTLLKEVCQIGNKPLPGTPSKPYPYPLNDSLSPGRLSQEQPTGEEETTTKKRKLQFNLDKMMDIKKKTEDYVATFNRLKQDVADGGFAQRLKEQPSTADDSDHEGPLEEEAIKDKDIRERVRKLKGYDYRTTKEQKIPTMHPGEAIFDQTKLRQIFDYDDHMASLAGCGFRPEKPSALESLMLKATPDEMVELLRTFAVEMAYHSKPCPPTFMLWLFRLMSVHTDCNVVNKAYQTMWSIMNIWPVKHPDVLPWVPSVLEFTQILVNFGASFSELLPSELVHPGFEEISFRLPNEDGDSIQGKETSKSSVDKLTDEQRACYHGNNLIKIIKIMTMAFITNKNADRFPYSDEEVCCLAVLLCKVSLEKYFVPKAVDNDFTLYLVALFECVSEDCWMNVAERMCHVLSGLTVHHHNLVYISSLMPACTKRGRYMSRQLSYMCLKKLSSDEPEQNSNGFYPDLKMEYILDLVPDERPTEDTDYYKLHSLIQLLDAAIGNEALEQSEKESLQFLIKRLKLFVTVIRESHNNVTRSQVKDLVVRMTLRLTLMDQAIITDQVNLYHRMLPLARIKQETIEEHFPQSQEDAVSISSESDGGEDKLDALDDDEDEEGVEHSRNEVRMGHSKNGTEVEQSKKEAEMENLRNGTDGEHQKGDLHTPGNS